MRMRRHYQHKIHKLPADEIVTYLAGARQLRAYLRGTSALPRPLNGFWRNSIQRPILQIYGSAELGAIFRMHIDDRGVPDGSLGENASSVDARLSAGDEEEVLVKSSPIFSKYLCDPEGTASAKDQDRYFRSRYFLTIEEQRWDLRKRLATYDSKDRESRASEDSYGESAEEDA